MFKEVHLATLVWIAYSVMSSILEGKSAVSGVASLPLSRMSQLDSDCELIKIGESAAN